MGDNTSTDKLSTPTNLYGNLPAAGGDSATKVKQFFNQYYTEPFEFASNTEILNYNRSKISTLGYKVDQATNKLETRNIVV